MEVKRLDWDSDFFEIEIGLLEAQTINDLKSLDHNSFDLIYLFINSKRTNHFSNNLNEFPPIDQKVIFSKSINVVSGEPNGSVFKESDSFDELYSLALESGYKSRFKVDEKFKEGKFEEMYKIWIKRSVLGEIADKVIVYKEDNKILGFVTVKIKSDKGVIGLIAVAPHTRGKGIGKKLMFDVELYLSTKNIDQIEVATQLSNKLACRFYERAGFSIKSITNIYHFWKM